MKKQMIRISLPAIALACLLLALSCGSPETSNSNQNSANVSSVGPSDPCGESTIDDKVTQLNIRLVNEMKADSLLAPQYQAGKFNMTAVKGSEYHIVVYVEGSVKGQEKFEKISDILDNFQKGGCVMRIVLRVNSADPGFEWEYCAEGTCPGPDGRCYACMTNSNSNAPANSNTNSNTNVNANSNSNARVRTN